MQSFEAHNKILYVSLLTASGFLVFAGLGPGLFPETASYGYRWQYQIFDLICHQDPARSYSISGIQMAVCSRCLGIYGFMFGGWVLLPLYAVLKKSTQIAEKNWLIGAIVLNLIDVAGNYFGLWTNTLLSRFLLGSLFGISLVFMLTNEFFTFNKTE